jgi:excinuclease ABC subunit B
MNPSDVAAVARHVQASRALNPVSLGFVFPSAFDNRPLKFEEVQERIGQTIYVSATQAREIEQSHGEIVQQIIRPTGLLDPLITVKPATYQVDECLEEIRKETEIGRRVLVTTLTKKLAEDLSKYLCDIGVKAKYLHSDIDTLERVQILNELRLGLYDVLVGINLLREGLICQVSSLLSLMLTKRFLRVKRRLYDLRRARNVAGRVVMYADKMTGPYSVPARCNLCVEP